MTIKGLGQRIRNRLWNRWRDDFYLQRVKEAPLILNINFDCHPDQKRALICYFPTFYFQSIDVTQLSRTIPFEIFKLVKVITGFGFCIDIISINDLKAIEFTKMHRYSLIFGFGEVFYRMRELQPDALSVFYVTENHPDFSFREERKRIEYFFERHGIKVPFQRSGRFYKAEHVAVKYDHVIVLGEAEQFAGQYEKPYTIFPTGFLNPGFVFGAKDHLSARKHFLWLGSSAVIHKGLDLLIDVFAGRDDVVLHVCGLDAPARELLKLPVVSSIIDYGFVNINSAIFLRIAGLCSYSILPSCSEGMATSIATSMLHGLIPVVMKDAGFNRLGDHAIFLDDFRIDYLNAMVSALAEYEPAEIRAFSEKVYSFAMRNFTPDAYEYNMRSIFKEILSVPT